MFCTIAHEVLFIVSISTGKRRSQDHSTASPKSESEHVRGTLGAPVKQECLSKLTLFGERPLWRVLGEYDRHYQSERNHQGKGNQLLFPDAIKKIDRPLHSIESRQRLGGLLKYYRNAA
jgi:hypothetical protein